MKQQGCSRNHLGLEWLGLLFIASILLVSLAPITTAALSEADKDYIELFNEYYEIISEDVNKAEEAYLAGEDEIYLERLDKLAEDVKSADALHSYSYGTSKQIKVRVERERIKSSVNLKNARYYAKTAYTRQDTNTYKKLREGMEHLEKAKSLLPESKVPGFSAILAIVGLLAVAYLLRRRK